MLRLTVSLMTSRLRDKWDPFWVAGRSTYTSIVQKRMLFLPALVIRTGFLTPVTPTLVSLKPLANFRF